MNYSRQRESIKDFLSTRKDHPTADTIYMNIRKQFPNISLGTIYRNLNLLSDIGEITRLTTGDGCDHYDFNTAPHNHFVCTRCHSVLDLEMDSIDRQPVLREEAKFCLEILGNNGRWAVHLTSLPRSER